MANILLRYFILNFQHQQIVFIRAKKLQECRRLKRYKITLNHDINASRFPRSLGRSTWQTPFVRKTAPWFYHSLLHLLFIFNYPSAVMYPYDYLAPSLSLVFGNIKLSFLSPTQCAAWAIQPKTRSCSDIFKRYTRCYSAHRILNLCLLV